MWARLGSRVTILEYLPTLLPTMDEDISKLAARLFARQGLELLMGVKVTGASRQGDRVTVEYTAPDGQATGVTSTISIIGDRVLVAVGRRPNTAGLGAEAAGLRLDRRGCIEVDEHFFTGVPGIYTIGDVIRGPMLAHKAEEEGIAAVEHMAGLPGHVNYDAVPNVIYTHPEIASVGKTEAELKHAGIP